MKNFKLLIGFFFFLNLNSQVINEISTYQKTENVCGIEFLYEKKIINGKRKISWVINNNQVDREEYFENYCIQKQRELEKEFAKEEEIENKNEEFKKEMQVNLVKKILILKIKDVEEAIKKIKDLKKYNLETYFDYDQNTFKNKNELDNVEKIIAKIKNNLENSSEETTLSELNDYLDKIENFPANLNNFFKASINNAINLCDDTKLLRKLLELVN